MKMSSENEIQKQISSIYFSDGFIDIMLGEMMIFLFFIRNSSGWIKYFLYGGLFIATASIHFIKRAVAFPRTGVMLPNFRAFKSTKIVLLIMGITLIICVIAFFYFAFFSDDWEPNNPDLVFEFMFIYFPIMLIVTIFAAVGRILRFLIHIAIYTIAFIMQFYFDSINLPLFSNLSIVIAGVVIISIGISVLIRFLRSNPIIKVEHRNDN